MGHEILYSVCDKCKGLTITTGKIKTTNCKCEKLKPTKQMESKDFEHMHMILTDKTIDGTTKNSQFDYWRKRVTDRVNYLTPIIKECKDKGYEIREISLELSNEWIELHACIDYYKFK